MHVPKGNAVKIIDLEPASFATLLARVVTEIGARRSPPAAESATSTCPLGPAGKAYGSISARAAPLSSTSTIGQRAQHSSATCNWRHRVDASDGESGGRAARGDEDEHARRAAAPSHLQPSFSHTCCPYRTVLYAALWRAAGKRAVERSEERLVKLQYTHTHT